MLTNYHPGGNIYRQSMDCKTEYGRVPEWPMGTDCKSAAFSFGGSNPPAPTKRTSVEITLVFCFARHLKSHSRGWIRTAAATSLKMAQKQPGGLFLAARLATSTRAHQKTSTYESALRFLFCDKAKLIGRVDSNSCGTVQQDDLQQCKDQQNNKNHSVPCIIIFCNGIQVGTLCIDFLNFSSKKSLTMLSVHDKITFDFERQSMAESFQSNLPWTAQRG